MIHIFAVLVTFLIPTLVLFSNEALAVLSMTMVTKSKSPGVLLLPLISKLLRGTAVCTDIDDTCATYYILAILEDQPIGIQC